MQAVVFFIIALIVVVSFVDKLIYRKKRFELAQSKVEYLYEISDDLRKYVIS